MQGSNGIHKSSLMHLFKIKNLAFLGVSISHCFTNSYMNGQLSPLSQIRKMSICFLLVSSTKSSKNKIWCGSKIRRSCFSRRWRDSSSSNNIEREEPSSQSCWFNDAGIDEFQEFMSEKFTCVLLFNNHTARKKKENKSRKWGEQREIEIVNVDTDNAET